MMFGPLRLRRIALLSALALSWLSVSAPAQATKVGLIIDGSSSISDAEWNTLRLGAANAIRKIKADGSVDLTVVRFGFAAFTVVGDQTINSALDRENFANLVETMARPTFQLSPAALAVLNSAPPQFADLIADLDFAQTGIITGGTNFEAAINQAVAAISIGVEPTLLNMLTDGNPTVHDGYVSAASGSDQLSVLGALNAALAIDPDDAARNARNAAISAGIDLLSFEAIGFSADDLALMTELAFPSAPGSNPPEGTVVSVGDPIPAHGFVIDFQNFDQVEAALDAKILEFGAAVPEPSLVSMLAAGLLGLGAYARSRRR